MALHVESNGERPDREEAAREQHVAGLIREAEMMARRPLDEALRAEKLAGIRAEVEAAGGDGALVPDAKKPAAARRSTRTSKAAASRSKRGAAKADD